MLNVNRSYEDCYPCQIKSLDCANSLDSPSMKANNIVFIYIYIYIN